MKLTTTLLLAAFGVVLVSSVPVPDNQSLRSQVLERLVMVEGDNEAALRSKRTIGILRQLFPGLTQIIEQKVNAITSEVIRILGPVILQSVLGGGAGRGGGGGGGGNKGGTKDDGTTVEAASPFDDDDDDNKDSGVSSSNGANKISTKSKSGSRISISFPTFPPDEEDDEATESSPSTIGSSTQSAASSSNVNQEAEDRLTEETAESQNNEVRVQFADEQANEAGGSELAPLEDVEVSDDENRNKRFLNFGFGASGGAGGAGTGGSGGGSGNFLFDIIRQAADGAARAAGTVYRVVAGTQSLGLGLSASRDVAPAPAPAAPAPSAPAANAGVAPTPAAAPAPGAGTQPPLVAGSGSSQQGDVAAGAPTPGRNDGTTEAVPGPVTRLFVIANRGISNLIQDLILRLAATSERIVNFKARLITSII